MSDNVNTSPLGIERTERIAGDEAINSKLDIVTAELQNTQTSVTTEVVHRSEGDLVVQRILEGYIKDLLDGKADDFERYIEFQNSQNLNYADVRNFVSGIRTSLADEIRNLSTKLMDNLQANDARYNKLVSDVGRYREILSDITLDSNQITLDNGELRAGAWTILSQAREWDLEIISRLNGLTASVGDSLKDAVEELQNQLPSTEATISKAIDELSKSPTIKNLTDLLNQSIANDTAYANEMVDQARQHARDMLQLAEDLRAEAQARAASVEAFVEGEVTTRIQEINKEVSARKEAINLLTEDMLERADEDKATFQADMAVLVGRITSAEDGLTSEIQHRKDGDTSTLNALNTYKVSNDSAITGLSTSLSNNVTKTSANTTLITGLTARMTTAETGIESATTAAADAMSKATTAVSANSALATRVDALAASITESDGTVVDVNAFNALKSEVNTVKGTVTGLVEDVTALESNYTSVNNKVTSQGTAISTLNTKMATAENSISQSANDITLLKADISSINAGLLTKVDSQAFSQLSSDVAELDGKYTTQAGLVTDLRGSLDTTNLNVSNAASAAQNALNTAGSKGKVIFDTSAPTAADRLSQNLWIDTTGNANTPKRWNGSAWVVVTDKVATDAANAVSALDTVVKTKADVSALNNLTTKVTDEAGKTTANTNSITTLNSDIAKINNDLATKANASALSDMYTKNEVDDKAAEIAAGEVSKYDASLVIGGTNLFSFAGAVAGYVSGTGSITNGTACHQSMPNLIPLGSHKSMTYQVWNPAEIANSSNTNRVAFFKADSSFLSFYDIPQLNGTTYQTLLIPIPALATHARLGVIAGTANGARDVNVKVKIEFGNKATDWSEADSAIVDSLNTNATAIENTNAEVTRVDGRVTTESNRITSLTGRVSTVEGAVSTKADASALNSLTTRVATEEGKSTSQGSAITSLQNTIKHATTGLSTKASSAALTAVDNKVTAVDGRVTATNSNVTNLTGRVSTVEGGLTTKADVSAVNALTTRVGNVEGGVGTQAADMTALKSSLGLYVLPTDKDSSQQNKWARITLRKTQPYISINVVPDYSYIGTYPEHSQGYFAEGATTTLPVDHSINYYRTLINVAAATTINLGNLMGDDAHAIYVDGKEVYRKTSYGTNACSFEVTAGDHVVDIVVNNGVGGAGFRSTITMSSQVTSMYAPKLTGVLIGNKAEASAIQTTNTEVSRINGVVSGHTTQLSNLTASIADKANTSALNTLTVRVTNAEGALTTQSSQTTALEAKISSFKAAGRNYLLDSKTVGTKSVNSEINTVLAPSAPIRMSFDIKIRTPVQAGHRNRIGFECSYTIGGTTYYCGVWLYNASSVGAGKLRVYFTHWLPSSWVAGVSAFPSTFSYYNQTSGGDFTVSNIKLEVGDAYTDWTPAPEDNASSSALNTLDTKVVSIDGRVTSQASQITTLTSDNAANKNALTVQAKVINGIKSSYMVKMETNGVIGGFGMIQESGAMGTVTTTFGVNADNFFIGAPSGGKKPFIVTTKTQTINGVSYPAGTWIDVALIANATIGTAKIADLAVTGAKIANATIGNAKISDLDASKINAGFINAACIQAGTLSADKLSSAAIETISLKARNGTFTAADGSKTVINGGLTEIFYPNGRIGIRLGIE